MKPPESLKKNLKKKKKIFGQTTQHYLPVLMTIKLQVVLYQTRLWKQLGCAAML